MINLEDARDRYSYDPITGIVRRTKRTGKSRAVIGPLTHIASNGYVIVNHGSDKYKAHRFAFFLMTGAWPTNDLDHIDGNRSNNKWANLRPATRSENMKNIRSRKNNTSGYKGVSLFRGRWVAQSQLNGRKNFLGYFDSAKSASEAYENFTKRSHGKFYKKTSLGI